MLLAVHARDPAKRADGNGTTERIEVRLAIGFQLVQRIDERETHRARVEGIHLDDVAFGGSGGVDAVVKFDDQFSAAGQRLVLTLHDYSMPEFFKNTIEKK